MFYSSSAESAVYTTEWLCDRMVYLIENGRVDDAAALATEWDEEGGIWIYPAE